MAFRPANSAEIYRAKPRFCRIAPGMRDYWVTPITPLACNTTARCLAALSIASVSRKWSAACCGRCFFCHSVTESLLTRQPVDLDIYWIRISKSGRDGFRGKIRVS